MYISQKAQYALRAAFELARRVGAGWVKMPDVAAAQAIPGRFLEVILAQMRQARLVVSKRGNEGGYMLAREPRELTVGEILRLMDGPVGPIRCVNEGSESDCPLHGDCAFLSVWLKVRDAMSDVLDNTTLQDLVDQEATNVCSYVADYAI